MFVHYLILLYLLIPCTVAAVVPEQLPSLLSELYFEIPQIKKGTDSRFGFGYSLGNHADFQIVYEIGPQKNTVPYGGDYSENSRRQTKNSAQKSWRAQKVSAEGELDILMRVKALIDRMTRRKKPVKKTPPARPISPLLKGNTAINNNDTHLNKSVIE